MKHTELHLVWYDDFDLNTLDLSKWEYEVNAFGGGNQELQIYTDHPKNVRVENNRLILEAHHEPTCIQGTVRDWSSGRVRTKHRGDWTYGRIEVRAKIPEGRGLWPAIWMMPTDDHYGTWAASGEIDIMENKGHQPRTVTGALHFGGAWPANKFVNHTVRRGLWCPKFSDDFFTYSIDWNRERIQWLVNDNIVRERRPDSWGASTGSHAPYDQRFHLLLNLAVGGHFPGPPDKHTRFPARMEIQGVRVWQRPQSFHRNGARRVVPMSGCSRGGSAATRLCLEPFRWISSPHKTTRPAARHAQARAGLMTRPPW